MPNESSRPSYSGSQFNRGAQLQTVRPMQLVPYAGNSQVPNDGNDRMIKQETQTFEDDDLCLFQI